MRLEARTPVASPSASWLQRRSRGPRAHAATMERDFHALFAMALARTIFAALLTSSLALGACTQGDDDIGSADNAATSAQDVEVARLRRRFRDARPARLEMLGSRSATGMKVRWGSCLERSARRDDASTRTVTYVFQGTGELDGISNEGTSDPKRFLRDATQNGADEILGYPAFTPGPTVTLDAVRFDEATGDLLVERVLKPSTDDAEPSLASTARTSFERSVYPDPRAYAVAYVLCPAESRTLEAGGKPVRFFDDCRDADFSRTWSNAKLEPGSVGGGVCSTSADYELRTPQDNVSVELVTDGNVAIEMASMIFRVEGGTASMEDARTRRRNVLFAFTTVSPGTRVVLERRPGSIEVRLGTRVETVALGAGQPRVPKVQASGKFREIVVR